MKYDERGQEIVLFGVLLMLVVVAGSVLALNLVWLRAAWTSLQEASVSAVAAGALEVQGLPGSRNLNRAAARKVTEATLETNLRTLIFLDGDPHWIARSAKIRAFNPPPGVCQPDPFGGPCHSVPFVTMQGDVPIRLPWGGQLELPIRAVAEAGQSPE